MQHNERLPVAGALLIGIPAFGSCIDAGMGMVTTQAIAAATGLCGGLRQCAFISVPSLVCGWLQRFKMPFCC